MNVATVKLVCWITSLAVVLGLGHAFWQYDQRRRALPDPAEERAYVSGVLERVVKPRSEVRDQMDYARDVDARFIEMNWTGEIVVVADADEPGEAVPAPRLERRVAELLQVLLLQVDEAAPGGSAAYVRYLGDLSEATHETLRIGDTLPAPHDGVRVHDIRIEGVEFAFADADRENEIVSPVRLAAEGLIVRAGTDGLRYPVPSTIPRVDGPAVRAPEHTVLKKSNHWVIGLEDSRYFAENYSRILTQDLQYRTYHDPQTGRRAGVQIQEVRAGSIAERHGAQSGDVVISINGHPVSSDHEAIAFAKHNADKYTTWNVEILRYGRPMTLTFESPQQ